MDGESDLRWSEEGTVKTPFSWVIISPLGAEKQLVSGPVCCHQLEVVQWPVTLGAEYSGLPVPASRK